MKKVCFVIPRAYYLFNPNILGAKDKVGGAQKQAYLLSTALAEDKSFDVNFLVADFGQKDFEEIDEVKIWKSFNFSNNIFKRIKHLLRVLRKINADTYIFRSADVGVGFAIFFVKLFLKKKTLYMIASDIETSKALQKKESGFLAKIFMQYVYNKADIVTAQTNKQAKNFLINRKRKPDAIIKNIYLLKKTTDKKQIKKTILWVGRITKNKQAELFINTAKKYPKENFVMIAPIVKEHFEYGKKIQESAKKIKSIKLINYVKPEDINHYYEEAKIYILSSYLEGFSNTMAEAMQAECPILSYNVNPDNIFEKYNCGLSSNKKTEKFYDNFEKLLKNEELCKELGKNGKNYIAEKHRKEVIIKEFKHLLNPL